MTEKCLYGRFLLEKLAIYFSYIYNISPIFIARSSPQKASYIVDFPLFILFLSLHTLPGKSWLNLVYHIREVWSWILQSLLLLSSFKGHSCHKLYRKLFSNLYSLLLDILLCFDRWVLHVSKGMDYYQSCKKNELKNRVLKHLHVYKYMSTKRIDIMIKLQVIWIWN